MSCAKVSICKLCGAVAKELVCTETSAVLVQNGVILRDQDSLKIANYYGLDSCIYFCKKEWTEIQQSTTIGGIVYER